MLLTENMEAVFRNSNSDRPNLAIWLFIVFISVVSLAAQSTRAAESAKPVQPFAGRITLAVDATDTDHGVFQVHETVPVQSVGGMRLLYPQWETASHAPTASAADLAGLIVKVDGRRVEWKRDPLQPYAFKVPTPVGAREIELQFQFVPPQSQALLRPQMIVVQWTRLFLYPAGWPASDLPVAATLRLPSSMRAFTSLDTIGQSAEGTVFSPAALERLADAPVYAASAYNQIDLTTGASHVRLDIVTDDSRSARPTAADLSGLRSLVHQTSLVFGQAPVRHYDMLVSLSDTFSNGGGIEHLEEGENNLPASFFVDQRSQLNNLDLMAHEFVHAWNGRSRQPADLWRPTFNEPASGSLLWVYEGQTEFWGRVLAARAGIRSRQETLDKLALDAAAVEMRPGRAWKTLADSSNDASYMAGRPAAWRSWQRREDYYSEGVLLWLDVDARLRELTGGRRSLDEFARRFFRAGPALAQPSLYDFDDVCAGLATVAPDDWRGFLTRHLETHEATVAGGGLSRAGWALAWSSQPSATFLQNEEGGADLSYSIGLTADRSGRVSDVVWKSPAFEAGLAPGARIQAVNGLPFSPATLKDEIAKKGDATQLGVEAFGSTRSVTIHYTGGLRYPTLQPIAGREDRLSPLLVAR